jgi:imidazolonepropionase
MIPALADWWPIHSNRSFPFIDVFCETGAFDLVQSRQILETAKGYGFPLKIHADEFDNLGGVSLAVELGAASADHLVVTSSQDIKALAGSDTVAVALPCTPFGLGEPEYTPAKEILDAGGILAIATDLNPGTAWCESMQFAAALACRYMKLTPNQAIAAATINAAAAIGMDEKVGSLEPGKQADLIILNIPDYRHFGYRFGTNLVETVIKQGQVYQG